MEIFIKVSIISKQEYKNKSITQGHDLISKGILNEFSKESELARCDERNS